MAHAAKTTERSKQKREAESQRADLQQKLSQLKRDIDRTETAKGRAADALSHSEAAISEANRALRDLAEEQAQTEAKLAKLAKEQAALVKTIEAQKKQLAKLLREHYVAGNEDRIKLLLSGDNPNRINRDLQYMGYVSQAQARLLDSLRANLQAVEENKAQVQNAKDELDEIAQEAREQKKMLEQENAKRANLLSELSSKLASQRKEASTLQNDERRLGGLVNKLAKLIEEQEKAEAIAREKRRQEQLARAEKQREKERQKEQDKLQRSARNKNETKAKTKNPDAIDDDVAPTKSFAKNELTPEPEVQSKDSFAGFSALRGQLRLPVKGEILARFGGKRGEGASWKGLFISAAEGAQIKAIANGRVVFAEWLRGFGNLIIVDHGNQYMSIYGNNQAVLKRPGDTVKTGDVIANVGNSGGNDQSGLYFEMRHQGRAFDPLGWVVH